MSFYFVDKTCVQAYFLNVTKERHKEISRVNKAV